MIQTVTKTVMQQAPYVAPIPVNVDDVSIWHHMSDALHQ